MLALGNQLLAFIGIPNLGCMCSCSRCWGPSSILNPSNNCQHTGYQHKGDRGHNKVRHILEFKLEIPSSEEKVEWLGPTQNQEQQDRDTCHCREEGGLASQYSPIRTQSLKIPVDIETEYRNRENETQTPKECFTETIGIGQHTGTATGSPCSDEEQQGYSNVQ